MKINFAHNEKIPPYSSSRGPRNFLYSLKDFLFGFAILARKNILACAKGVNRDIISLTPSYMGISVAELAQIALGAMQAYTRKSALNAPIA